MGLVSSLSSYIFQIGSHWAEGIARVTQNDVGTTPNWSHLDFFQVDLHHSHGCLVVHVHRDASQAR